MKYFQRYWVRIAYSETLRIYMKYIRTRVRVCFEILRTHAVLFRKIKYSCLQNIPLSKINVNYFKYCKYPLFMEIPSNKIVKLIIKLDQSEISLHEALKNSRDRADLFTNVYI